MKVRQSQGRTISKHWRWRPCAEAGDSTHRIEPFVGHDIRVSAEQVRERVDLLDPCVTRVEFFVCGDSGDRPKNAARESVRFAYVLYCYWRPAMDEPASRVVYPSDAGRLVSK